VIEHLPAPPHRGDGRNGPIVGILGGLGPRASAAFLQSVYRRVAHRPEQDQPRVVLWSDPTVPDRSAAIMGGDHDELAVRIADGIAALERFGADVIVVCCFTAHAVLTRVSATSPGGVVSLLDVAIDELARARRPHLLACTQGARQARIFVDHDRAADVTDLLVLPTDDDQHRIHELIYVLKRGVASRGAARALADIARRYPVDGVLAGCTELHLLSARAGRRPWPALLDPLDVVAASVARWSSPGALPVIDMVPEAV
jgi:aspartate racemase